MIFKTAAAIVASAGLMASSSAATTSAYSLVGGTGWANEGGGTWGAVGFEFTTTTAISVTHLGVHDWFGDGLVADSQVAIWSATVGDVVASVTVPAGTGASLVEDNLGKDYLQAVATPVILAPGTYVIANFQQGNPASEILGFGGTAIFAPEVNYVKGWAIGGATFQDPRNAGGFSDATHPTSYIGPQFKYDVVPEPATGAMALGLAAMGCMVRRRA
jgi:hypothetical protein